MNCVSVALDAIYPDCPIFVELVPNNLPKRCFILDYAGTVDVVREMANRWRVSGTIDIKYIAPKRGDVSKKENNAVFLEISLKLRHLTYKELKLRIDKHQRRDVDDVMHDICDFTIFVYELNSTPAMQTLTQRPNITT